MPRSQLDTCLEALATVADDEIVWRVLRREAPEIIKDAEAGVELVSRVISAAEDTDNETESNLLEAVLEQARMDDENDGRHGSAFLSALDDVILRLCDEGKTSRAGLFLLGRCYVRAGLHPPQALRQSVGAEFEGALDPAEIPGLDELLDQLRDEAQDDAYTLHAALSEMLASIDPKLCAAVVEEVVGRGEPVFDRLGLYWLLDGEPDIREAAAGALLRRVQSGRLDAALASRLVEMRNWLPADAARDQLDRVLKEALKREVSGGHESRPWTLHRLVATLPDGAGAQSVAIAAQQGSKRGLVMLLLKEGFGVKDAFVAPCQNATEQKTMLAHLIEETDALDITPEFLGPALSAALAEGLDIGVPPAHGLIDVLDIIGFRDLRPTSMSTEDWLASIDPDGEVASLPSQKFGRLINASADWPHAFDVVESWFEDSAEVQELLMHAATRNGRANALWEHLETRREWWSRLIAKVAATLKYSSDDTAEDWKSFAATALALLQGRPLHKVPIMRWVVEMSLEAAEVPQKHRDLTNDPEEVGTTPWENADLPSAMTEPAPEGRGELKRLMKASGMGVTPIWLDGYLMAIVIAPKLIAPSEWLNGLLQQARNFTSEDELQRFLDIVIQRYNVANAEMVDPSANNLQVKAQDKASLRRWSAGFTEGVTRHKNKWPAKATNKDDKAILKLIAAMAAGASVAPELKSILPTWLCRRRALRA